MLNKNIQLFNILCLFLLLPFTLSAQKFNPPEWSYNKAIYEVNIRQYTKEGNFKAFEQQLPKLKELGADILWFMPIHPIGEENRKGSLGSYYSVKDYKAVNPEFGTLEEFKSLVKMIHKMGMYVIIDWVANHTAWNNQWVVDHPEYYTTDSLGNMISPNMDWTDVADLNYDNQKLWVEMIQSMKFWVEEYDIDGFRCDVAGMVPIEFWMDARTELEKTKKLFMLAEWDTPEIHLVFDMSYDWKIHDIMNGIIKKEKTVTDLIQQIEINQNVFPSNSFRMEFTSNHDKNSWNGTVFERLGDGVETFAVLTCVIPDMPLVYSGQEAGNSKRLLFFEKDTIEWKDYKLFNIYSKLFELKRNNKALFNGDHGGKMIFLECTDEENIFAFTRKADQDKILAIFNLSDQPIEFDLIGGTLLGTYKNLFTGKLESFPSSTSFSLNAWEYRIYTR